MPRRVNWKLADTVACYKEGWAPFTFDDGSVILCALDDPDGVAKEHGFAPFSGIFFEGHYRDDKACEYVKQHAAKGSRLHQRALALCKKTKKGLKHAKTG